MATNPSAEIIIDVEIRKCPECGPHGNQGKVALLYSWVDCLTCNSLHQKTVDAIREYLKERNARIIDAT